MNRNIRYALGGLAVSGLLAFSSFIGYQAGKYNGIKQGREDIMGTLKEQAQTLYDDAKNSGSVEDKKRLLIESDALNVVISDLEKISLEAEEIATCKKRGDKGW